LIAYNDPPKLQASAPQRWSPGRASTRPRSPLACAVAQRFMLTSRARTRARSRGESGQALPLEPKSRIQPFSSASPLIRKPARLPLTQDPVPASAPLGGQAPARQRRSTLAEQPSYVTLSPEGAKSHRYHSDFPPAARKRGPRRFLEADRSVSRLDMTRRHATPQTIAPRDLTPSDRAQGPGAIPGASRGGAEGAASVRVTNAWPPPRATRKREAPRPYVTPSKRCCGPPASVARPRNDGAWAVSIESKAKPRPNVAARSLHSP
jgi:hypothetical protein